MIVNGMHLYFFCVTLKAFPSQGLATCGLTGFSKPEDNNGEAFSSAAAQRCLGHRRRAHRQEQAKRGQGAWRAGEKWWKTQHSNRFLCIFCMINHHHPLHPSQLAQDLPVKKQSLKCTLWRFGESTLYFCNFDFHCNTHLFQEKNCKNCLTSPITR